MCRICQSDSFEERIERMRQKMLEAAEKFGLNHPEVLHFSQELDKLHTCYFTKMAQKSSVG
ncbi:Spo0E family sporulation regulatory protein-aspartic acid phosphatase [Alkalihalobacillus sp. NPDC078783]